MPLGCRQPECSVVENEIEVPFARIGILIFLEWPRVKPSPRFVLIFSAFLNCFVRFIQVSGNCGLGHLKLQVVQTVCNKWTHFQQIFPKRANLDKH